MTKEDDDLLLQNGQTGEDKTGEEDADDDLENPYLKIEKEENPYLKDIKEQQEKKKGK